MEFKGYSHNTEYEKEIKKISELGNEEDQGDDDEIIDDEIQFKESSLKKKVIEDVIDYLKEMIPEDKNMRKGQLKRVKKDLKQLGLPK